MSNLERKAHFWNSHHQECSEIEKIGYPNNLEVFINQRPVEDSRNKVCR